MFILDLLLEPLEAAFVTLPSVLKRRYACG
jgi:hypothetical protein